MNPLRLFQQHVVLQILKEKQSKSIFLRFYCGWKYLIWCTIGYFAWSEISWFIILKIPLFSSGHTHFMDFFINHVRIECEKSPKCYWIKKQKGHFCIHLSNCLKIIKIFLISILLTFEIVVQLIKWNPQKLVAHGISL